MTVSDRQNTRSINLVYTLPHQKLMLGALAVGTLGAAGRAALDVDTTSGLALLATAIGWGAWYALRKSRSFIHFHNDWVSTESSSWSTIPRHSIHIDEVSAFTVEKNMLGVHEIAAQTPRGPKTLARVRAPDTARRVRTLLERGLRRQRALRAQ